VDAADIGKIELHLVPAEEPDQLNLILGQSHLIQADEERARTNEEIASRTIVRPWCRQHPPRGSSSGGCVQPKQ
jgi:hypothetical protein